MIQINKVMIAGNLVRDPEFRKSPRGNSICEFVLAANHRYNNGERTKEEVCYIDVEVFGKVAENCFKFLFKGSPVFLEGRLMSGRDKKHNHDKTLIRAEKAQFLGKGNKEEN